jgi:hypothetical protein
MPALLNIEKLFVITGLCDNRLSAYGENSKFPFFTTATLVLGRTNVCLPKEA